MLELNDKRPFQTGASANGTEMAVTDPDSTTKSNLLLDAALTWLARGVPLVPIQPRSKHLVRGFGPHQRQITTLGECAYWFRVRAVNLGLVCGGRAGLVCLDFDDLDIFRMWIEQVGGLAESYAELTTRGAHMFFRTDCNLPSKQCGMFELKASGAVIMAAPSVGPTGFVYRPVNHRAKILDTLPTFLLLSERPKRKDVNDSLSRLQANLDRSKDIVSRVKAAWPILSLAESMTKLTSGDGRWFHGLCQLPGHKDHKPSFWVDAERGVFGCYACNVRGDVVNLYALRHGMTVKDAICEMAAKLPGR